MHELPQARTEGLITERVDDELVIYDQTSHTAHCLSSTASSVWGLCDGATPAEAMAQQLSLPPADVARALDELARLGLLDVPAHAHLYSRRQAGVRIAKVGGAALSAPLIYSAAIAPAMAAASTPCTANGQAPPTGGCPGTPGGATGSNSACCSGTCYVSTNGGTVTCAPSGCGGAGASCSCPSGDSGFPNYTCSSSTCCTGTCHGSNGDTVFTCTGS